MTVRLIAITLTLGACAGLWFGYTNLRLLRGTPLFDYRYIVFAVAAFLGLSALEWAVGRLKGLIDGPDADP